MTPLLFPLAMKNLSIFNRYAKKYNNDIWEIKPKEK